MVESQVLNCGMALATGTNLQPLEGNQGNSYSLDRLGSLLDFRDQQLGRRALTACAGVLVKIIYDSWENHYHPFVVTSFNHTHIHTHAHALNLILGKHKII